MRIFLGLKSLEIAATPPLAFPGRASDYELSQPPVSARISVDDYFRFCYRASAVSFSVNLSWKEGGSDYTVSGSGRVPRSGYNFYPLDGNSQIRSNTIIENIVSQNRGDDPPYIILPVTVLLRRQNLPDFQYESMAGMLMYTSQDGKSLFLNDGIYYLDLLGVFAAGAPGQISGRFLGSSFRTGSNSPESVNSSGSVVVGFSGSDLPLF